MPVAPSKRKRRLFPRTLSECVDPALKPVFKKKSYAHARILRDWNTIAGPEVARLCQPSKLTFPRNEQTGGTLTLNTAGGGAALELHYQIPLLIEKLALYFGYRAVEKIRFQQTELTPTQAPVEATKPKAPITLPDIDADDPDIKSSLEKLFLAMQQSSQ